jgi:salicylate hydroxylase
MDGVVLGECLRHAKTLADLPACIDAFEAIIKPRSERIVALTHEQVRRSRATRADVRDNACRQRHVNHLPDGDEQRARDALMAEQNTREKRTDDYPMAWTSPKNWAVC